MNRRMTVLLVLVIAIFCACRDQHTKEEEDFFEVRLTRSTALEGGETFLLRRVGGDWSAKLMGNGLQFSCLYQREVKPSGGDWTQLYNSLLTAGLMEISGEEEMQHVEDGDSFYLEVTSSGKVSRYSVSHPREVRSENSKRILKVGNIVNEQFGTPVFLDNYDRGAVGEYLINNCEEYRN